ncbi:MAG: hypothetical protein IT236_03390 [Bacteroidia bacterium]|nr:hypothetical protein [Bacteroidia bacterium]
MVLKEEITSIIDTMPEDFQKELLIYLKKLEKLSLSKAKMSIHLQTILTEDAEVLKRLAQ